MASQAVWRARNRATTVNVRRAPRGRFVIGVSRDELPGGARVFLALSSRHAARLLRSLLGAQYAAGPAAA